MLEGLRGESSIAELCRNRDPAFFMTQIKINTSTQ
jgi:hypothetical protein